METELSFLPPVYLGQGTAAESSLSQEEMGGGGEREGESACLKPDHSGLEWFSPAALGPSCSTALQYHMGAVEGGRVLTLRSFSGEGPRPTVPLPQFHVDLSPSRPEFGIQGICWRCRSRVTAVPRLSSTPG